MDSVLLLLALGLLGVLAPFFALARRRSRRD
jgi:hypothetical protein